MGGAIVRVEGELCFVSADCVRAVAPRPVTTTVAGTAVGISLMGGHIGLVVPLGEPSEHALLCEVDGEPMIVTGVVAVASGHFERAENGVVYEGQIIRELDVSARFRELERSVLAPGDPRSSRRGS